MERLFKKQVTPSSFTRFVLPSVIMFIFMASYALVDLVVVANFLGSNAVAAINIAYPVVGLGWGISIMLASGSSALVAIGLGEGQRKFASERFSLICVFSAALGIVLGLLGLLFLNPLLHFLGVTPTLWEDCASYTAILLLGTPAIFLGTLLEYFIRVDGKPGFTLLLYLSGGIVHLVLDVVFIGVFKLGLEGAGYATIAGQFTVLLLGLSYFLTQKTTLSFTRFPMDRPFLKSTLLNGSSEMVSECSVAVTTFVFNLMVLRLAGENGVAALGITLNSHYLLISMHLGFVTGVSPLISYYYGASDYEKVKIFIRYSRNFLLASSAFIGLIAFIGAPVLAGVFVAQDSPVFEMSSRGIRFLSLAFLFTGINVFASGFFTAYGNGFISALLSLTRGLLAILVGASILPYFFGLDGVFMTVVFAEIITLALSLYLFRKYKPVYHY